MSAPWSALARRSVLTGLAGVALALPAVLIPTPTLALDEDAALVAMCRDYLAGMRDFTQQVQDACARWGVHQPPDIEADRDARCCELLDDVYEIAAVPATTAAGRAAKAYVLWVNLGNLRQPEPGDDAFWFWSLAQDAAAAHPLPGFAELAGAIAPLVG